MKDSFLGKESGPRRTTIEDMRVFQVEKPPKNLTLTIRTVVSGGLIICG